MIANLQNLISKVLSPSTPVTTLVPEKSKNPFENPFVNEKTNNFYGKNAPVKGGYFAGYYNNKPNIVGRRLFIEVWEKKHEIKWLTQAFFAWFLFFNINNYYNIIVILN